MNHPPLQFKEGCRGILLLHRNKDGCKGNAQRNSIKKISRCPDEFDEIIEELREIQKTYPLHRIYSSVNRRNIDKGIREFKRRQLEIDYESKANFHSFYADIKNRFFSSLMNPLARDESQWLIDCDTPEEYEQAKRLIDPSLHIYEYPTKNGWHIITKPFNPVEFENITNIEIKKDDLIYIQ